MWRWRSLTTQQKQLAIQRVEKISKNRVAIEGFVRRQIEKKYGPFYSNVELVEVWVYGSSDFFISPASHQPVDLDMMAFIRGASIIDRLAQDLQDPLVIDEEIVSDLALFIVDTTRVNSNHPVALEMSTIRWGSGLPVSRVFPSKGEIDKKNILIHARGLLRTGISYLDTLPVKWIQRVAEAKAILRDLGMMPAYDPSKDQSRKERLLAGHYGPLEFDREAQQEYEQLDWRIQVELETILFDMKRKLINYVGREPSQKTHQRVLVTMAQRMKRIWGEQAFVPEKIGNFFMDWRELRLRAAEEDVPQDEQLGLVLSSDPAILIELAHHSHYPVVRREIQRVSRGWGWEMQRSVAHALAQNPFARPRLSASGQTMEEKLMFAAGTEEKLVAGLIRMAEQSVMNRINAVVLDVIELERTPELVPVIRQFRRFADRLILLGQSDTAKELADHLVAQGRLVQYVPERSPDAMTTALERLGGRELGGVSFFGSAEAAYPVRVAAEVLGLGFERPVVSIEMILRGFGVDPKLAAKLAVEIDKTLGLAHEA